MIKELVIAAIIGLVVLGFWLVGATRPVNPVDVTVNMADYTIDVSPETLPASTPLRFTFINRGVIVHHIVLEKVGAMKEPINVAGADATIQILGPGERQSIVWTIGHAGLYQLACHLPGHYEGGMVHTLRVTPFADILYGRPTQLARALSAGMLFLFLEAGLFSVRRYFGRISQPGALNDRLYD